MAEKLAGQAAVIQINSQENQLVAARFGVRGIPSIILLRQGKAVARLQGAQSVEAVLSWFRRQI